MKSINVYDSSHGFAYIDGRLIECEIKKMDFCFRCDGGCDKYLVVAHADWTEKITPDNFYGSIQDFNNDNPARPLRELWLTGWFRQLAGYDDKGHPFTFIIKNGRVVKYTVEFDVIEVFYDDGKVHHLYSADIPNECWSTDVAARSHIGYEIVSADGSVTSVPAASSLVALTDEQREAVSELILLCKRLKDLGVCIVADWNGMYAFNRNNVADFKIEYDETTGYEGVDVLSDEFAVPCDLIVSSDENMLNIKRKQS